MKPTYEQKMLALNHAIAMAMTPGMKEVYQAIKTDLEKANSRPVKPAQDNTLYNKSMGVYRAFLKARNSHLDMTGRKAFFYSSAMRKLITYLTDFATSNQRPHGEDDIMKAVEFLFNQDNWNRLNDYHRNRIKLPDIYENIEEILPMMLHGHTKKSAAKTDLQLFKQSLTKR